MPAQVMRISCVMKLKSQRVLQEVSRFLVKTLSFHSTVRNLEPNIGETYQTTRLSDLILGRSDQCVSADLHLRLGANVAYLPNAVVTVVIWHRMRERYAARGLAEHLAIGRRSDCGS